MINRTAVNNAPERTVRHLILTSGSTLKTMQNIRNMIPKDNKKLIMLNNWTDVSGKKSWRRSDDAIYNQRDHQQKTKADHQRG